MTTVTMESLEASGFDGMIKEGPEAFGGCPGPRPCFVHHQDAGGWCERTGTVEAYGIAFCDVHGAEVKAGILAEIYHDAGNVLEDAYGAEDSSMNPAAWVHLQDVGRREMSRRCVEAEQAQVVALLKAYPVIEERVDSETRERDFRVPHVNEAPVDVFVDARGHMHRLMRLSWSVGQDWILEVLEEEREGASAQLAFALAFRAQQTGQPA